ncbi:MAG TPA: NADH-quinone oxidoreductase subunit NuoH [Pyrinomonadaceae bacterium]|jgi:NADH-quinone oxidoreductase subunit H|nr:NADH-quinone oxidoreductase subunit NuoH [Pyrinomonadaceae bacterium]
MDLDLLILLGLKFLAIAIAFNVVLIMVAYIVLAERKILGWIQGRIGPNRVGFWGVLQPFADLLKFIFKEDIIPDKSVRFVYFLAPLVALICALMPIVVYPFGPEIDLSFIPYAGEYLGKFPLVIARFDVALLYVLGITSVGVYGIALAGWSSNSKYSLMGGLRSSAQMISYELAMGTSVVGAVMLAGTLDINGIITSQRQFVWYIIPQFLGFIVFLISAFAETNRVPFDLPEAETELVAGFHTEYSALKFALFFMAEYVNMFTVSVMIVTLFLGGWHVPYLNLAFAEGSLPYAAISVGAFLAKIFFFLFFYIWVRGTLPRFRFDQLMNFGWKFLLPLGIFNVFITALAVYFWNIK